MIVDGNYVIGQHNASVLKRFEKDRRVNGIGTRTLKNDMQALRKLAEFLGNTQFEKATKRDIIDFFDPEKLKPVCEAWKSRNANIKLSVQP